MKTRIKNIIVNTLFCVLSIVLFGQVIFLMLRSLIKNNNNDELEVYASSDMTIFKKTGLLNLIDGNVDFTIKEQVKIENKSDFAKIFNAYFANLKNYGGYTLESDYIVSGTSKKLGMTAYQATSSRFEVSENGDVFSEISTVEVPDSNGDLTGQGKSLAKRIWLTQDSQKAQTTSLVDYEKENGRYKTISDFSESEVVDEEKNRVCSLLPFVIDESTIDEIEIIASNLVYQVEISLNYDGYKQIAIDTMEQGDAIKMPEFKYFKVKVVVDKFGNILSLGFAQNYDLTIRRFGIEITAETKSSSDYLVRKRESL